MYQLVLVYILFADLMKTNSQKSKFLYGLLLLFSILSTLSFLFVSSLTGKELPIRNSYVKSAQPPLAQSVSLSIDGVNRLAISPSPIPTSTLIPTPTFIQPVIAKTAFPVNSGQVPVLMYHYIGDYYDPKISTPNNNLMHGLAVRVLDFDKQMSHLVEKKYKTIDMAKIRQLQASNSSIPKGYIMISFDDGYADFYTNAYPILQKYNIHGTVYIVSKFVGQSGYLTWDQIKEMQKSSLVSIGSHTLHHKYLTSLSTPEIQDEVANSKVELEQNLGASIPDFCYPYGNQNSLVVEAVQKAGYKTAVTTSNGNWKPGTDPFLIPRQRISGYTTFEVFSQLF